MSFGEATAEVAATTVVQLRPMPSLVPRADRIVSADVPRHDAGARKQGSDVALRKAGPIRSHSFVLPDDNLSSQDLLQILLSHVYEEEHASKLARQLVERFANLGNILNACPSSLSEFCDEMSIRLLRTVYCLMKSVFREPVEDCVLLRDLPALYNYLRVTLSFEQREVVRLLFLNSKNALLQDELHSKGTINHTPVYPREIVKRVIELNANALIIVHNHPSGDPSPSKEDIAMTKLLGRVLKDIGVQLHDHIIVGRTRCESLRSLGFM